jgi:high affinity Mn2+ porin
LARLRRHFGSVPNLDWPYCLRFSDANGTLAHLFLRQTIGFGGEEEDVPDGQLTLARKQDVSRLTLIVGRFTVADIFDTNTYANDPRTQFMNWGLVNNEGWDYPADTRAGRHVLLQELSERPLLVLRGK